MADPKDLDWITVNGRHVPILDGEFKQDAFNRVIAKNNEDAKQRQIAENKKQADKLNASEKKLPKRLRLPNKSGDEANKTSDVSILGSSKRFRFAKNSYISDVVVFCGKGTSTVFRNAAKFANRKDLKHLGAPEEWQHCSGKAKITDGRSTYVTEVHWVNGNDGKIREAYVKYPETLGKPKNKNGGKK